RRVPSAARRPKPYRPQGDLGLVDGPLPCSCDLVIMQRDSAVVAAVQAYAKINAQGQWIDRSEYVNLNELFERMTRKELEAYAKDGALPGWFSQAVSATPINSQEIENDD